MPKRLACLAVGASTRTLIAREKKYAPHPGTGQQVLVSPPIFITFSGERSLFLDDQVVKMYGFPDLKSFFSWLTGRGEVAKGEITFSACLGGGFRPVSDMGVRDVDLELHQRMLLEPREQIDGTPEEKAAALLELRRIAGESVPEPRRVQAEPAPVPAVPEGTEERMSEEILGKFSAGRR